MDFNFNGQYPFPWHASNPYMPNGFNPTAGTPQPAPTAAFSINQPIPGSSPVTPFNSNVLHGCRLPTGIYPFGINGPFQPSAPQNPQFGSNWNFGYNSSLPRFNQVQSPENQHSFINPLSAATPSVQLAINSVMNQLDMPNLSKPNNNMDIVNQVSKEKSSEQDESNNKMHNTSELSKDDLTEEIALKVSCLLSNSKLNGSFGNMSNSDVNMKTVKPDVDLSTDKHLSSELKQNLDDFENQSRAQDPTVR